MRDQKPRQQRVSPRAEQSVPSGFEAVHAAHRESILGYLRRLTGDPSLAEDLTQETFLRASRSLPGFRGDSRLGTWLYRIATHVHLDHRRKEAVRSAAPHEIPPDLASTPAQRSSSPGLRLPDLQLEDSEMGKCLREFVERLPAAYRAAIVLHDLQGLTNPEIAEILDCSLETAKIRVHRARQQLRALLTENCELDCDDGTVRCDRKQPVG